MTSEDGLAEASRHAVEKQGAALVEVSPGSVSWVPMLVGKARIAAARNARQLPQFDAAIVTALGSELDAVLRLDFGWANLRISGDPTLYHKGSFFAGGRDWTILAASALHKGMAASASLATKVAVRFRPKVLAMTGICAGVKGKAELGDVIVGDPTWDWGSGKHALAGDGSPVFKLSPVQRPLNTAAANLCREISSSADFKRRVRAEWHQQVPQGNFQCHVGPMASGASVISDRGTAFQILEQNRDLLGIEMEAFAVMAACEHAADPPPIGIAIKSVCDFADEMKHDGWQDYAAYTSAQFAREFLKVFFERV